LIPTLFPIFYISGYSFLCTESSEAASLSEQLVVDDDPDIAEIFRG